VPGVRRIPAADQSAVYQIGTPEPAAVIQAVLAALGLPD
jgi:hypothetical protein